MTFITARRAVVVALPLCALVAAARVVPQAVSVMIGAVMVDPAGVPDARGEWVELRNFGARPVDLSGWRLASGGDAGFTIPRGTTLPAGRTIVLARDRNQRRNGGMRAELEYTGLVFANGADWLALRDAAGVTRDSVAWRRAPRGVPLYPARSSDTIPHAPVTMAPVQRQDSVTSSSRGPSPASSELVVRVLDVGQGDAILIQNGGSTVLVDGGPNPAALGAHLDALGLNGGTLDAVVLSHAHADHYQGLRELFATRRRITVRYVWENQDPSPNASLGRLRDSIGVRVRAGTLTYRDTDDPCANGQPICVVTLRGGARLEIMRPDPLARDANDRSPALKLVGPDSASFTMWMAGDAEQEALDFFDRTAGYARAPGMRVNVLKADHHGSCNGVSDRYLELLHPELVVASVGAVNDYGHMHEQAKAAFARHGIPWYRTDQNGTIILRSPGTPGGGYTVSIERGTTNMRGPSDRRSTQGACAGM